MSKRSSNKTSSRRNEFLRACLRLHRGNFLAVIVFSFVINILMLTVPLYLLQIFNRVVPSKSGDTLLFLTGIVLVAVATMAVLEALRRYIFVRFGSWLDGRLGGFVLSGSITRSVRKFRRTSAQGLDDLATLRRLFAGSALFPILDAPWTPIFLLVLFSLHPLIGLISLAGALVLLGLAFINEISTRGLIGEANDATTTAKNFASAILRNSDVIEAMGMRKNIIGAWGVHHGSAVDLQTRSGLRGNSMASIARFIRTLLQIAVIGVAGVLVLQDQMTAGALIASALLMRRAVAPMDRAISSWKTVVRARQAFDQVSARLDDASELKPVQELPMPVGHLSVRHASFAYPGASKPILKDVTFRAEPGDIIGLGGETAAGKSTLGRLLVGLAEPDAGYIHIGGVSITRWQPDVLGPLLGYLPQGSELFPGTVRQNIARMGDSELDAVTEAAQVAGVHDMIMQFPRGYDTQIGEDGAYLSGGQRQRVALARAVFGTPKLLVLDEPDANLDSQGKAALASAIETMSRCGCIVFLISHQDSVLSQVDRLLLLRNGQIELVSSSKSSSSSRLVKLDTKQRD